MGWRSMQHFLRAFHGHSQTDKDFFTKLSFILGYTFFPWNGLKVKTSGAIFTHSCFPPSALPLPKMRFLKSSRLPGALQAVYSTSVAARDATPSSSLGFEHTIYSGRELKDRLLHCGFGSVQLYGSLAGAPYDQDAARLVAVARK